MGFNRYEKMADELPKDVAKWSVDDVETYLTFKMDGFDEDDIKAIKGGRVNGKCLFQLTAGILVSEEFKIKFTHAVAIMELVKELNDKRDKEVEEQLESLSLDKTKKTPGIFFYFSSAHSEQISNFQFWKQKLMHLEMLMHPKMYFYISYSMKDISSKVIYCYIVEIPILMAQLVSYVKL
ncbi:hypothetical protein C1646_709990 [Rhizophagus diaphanus]|nr:hypothetical protein C1646_709990 [Rhizophagus diaphanus] [Rhizophagus sp. MUCL 43196]